MDKRIAGLLGAAAALTAMNGAQAAAPSQSTELAPPASYRELLDPVPNALVALKSDDARHTQRPASGETQLAYHHHHHHGWRRWHHHHHHHGWGRWHHHHHHHNY
jgi:hypothetical protein